MHSYASHLRQRKRHKEDNDCSVRAVAVVCGVSYRTARAALAREGRKPKGTATWGQIQQALQALGFDAWNVRPHFGGRTVRTVEQELPRGYRFILDMHAHVAAWNGHTLVDHATGSLRRVTSIFLIIETPNHVRRNRK